ncbi:ABC transporter ATP-binding protein [Herbiconiux sp. L3-i23]|uniref:ABC transporter ATP-binding protein n=1 Tax=Herbiconiux sp. L3-i23 TaxID=2905871 RepID=UPI00205F3A14|nr:ABC transporter ATP-binding protein [Herbiconiux sp. L3-i23]BDI21988.1 ABC transporter [Herbiconiux sp. L3-i23]
MQPLLRMRDIVKRFGAMTAVDHVDLEIRAGEVHALLGENGAGKSTLMNCLFGLVRPDEGSIEIDGEAVEITNPRRALALGVGMVHQHFKLVPSLTVAENVFLGTEAHAGPFVLEKEQIRTVERLSAEYGLEVKPRDKVRSLSVGAQQRVEILRALAKDVRILVLDEPTAVLTPAETERFFEVVRGFAKSGLAVVLISHHLSEVRRIADRVTVLRRGVRVATEEIGAVTNADLAALITGDAGFAPSDVEMGTPGEVRLEVEELRLKSARGLDVVDGVSLTVRAGEIVGVLGIAGNGQTELVEGITGLRALVSGRVVVGGTDVSGRTPGAVRSAGLVHIPEDRIGRGMAGYWSVGDNIAVGRLDGSTLGGPFLSRKRIGAFASDLMARFDVRASSSRQLAKRLSGGNAQKMVLARELSKDADVVVCAEPTRGLDIAATAFVRAELVKRRDAGGAILLVSSEIEEVTQIADRVLVMSAGRIVAEYSGRRPTEAEVGRAMLEGKS